MSTRAVRPPVDRPGVARSAADRVAGPREVGRTAADRSETRSSDDTHRVPLGSAALTVPVRYAAPAEFSSTRRPRGVVSEPVGDGAFAPTHEAPDTGLSTWSEPDPTLAPDNHIGPSLPVMVIEETTGWARVRCENGWETWVDTAKLVRIEAPPFRPTHHVPPGGLDARERPDTEHTVARATGARPRGGFDQHLGRLGEGPVRERLRSVGRRARPGCGWRAGRIRQRRLRRRVYMRKGQ